MIRLFVLLAIQDELFSKIYNHAPICALGLVVLIGVVFLAWHSSKLHSQFNSIVKKIDTVSDNIGGISKNLTGVEMSVSDIRHNVSHLAAYLKAKDKTFDMSLFRSLSPIMITELGHRLLEISGGKEFVDQNIEALFSQLEKYTINSALDVQNYSDMVITHNYANKEFKAVKDYIYNNPVYRGENGLEISFSLETATNLMGIYLRDKYLEKHPEINS